MMLNMLFLAAKDVLLHAPVQASSDFCCPFTLAIDASFSGAGALLLQPDDNFLEYPVFFFLSKSFHHANVTTVQ